MLMLHISDIHFKAPECLDTSQDPDLPVRTRLMRDLAQQVKRIGKIDALLIGGDIAFKADPDEYSTAWDWIQELASMSGCSKERIFVVPGNHDVDRNFIRTNVQTQSAQHMIASAPPHEREGRLRQQLRDEASGRSLFAPHDAYNEFAAPLGCQIWPEKPFWHQDLQLGSGVTLRIYGLTSTLLSGLNGNDETQGDLYLSPIQTVLDPVPNTANLVLVHHPIHWFSDDNDVDDALTSRASFHLFGHEHRQRAVMADYVRIAAGAVNPSRTEQPYQPGYNLIALEVTGEGCDRGIEVKLYQRRLQDNPERFTAIQNQQGQESFTTRISIPEEPIFPDIDEAMMDSEREGSSTDVRGENTASEQDAEAAMGEPDTRDLLYRFWRLRSSQRRRIARDLELLSEGEMAIPEPERYGRAFIRAGERDLIGQVAAAVAKFEERR